MAPPSSLFSFLLLTITFTSSTLAFRVTPGSPCASSCGNTKKTTISDMDCQDGDIDSKPAGQAMKKCYECLQNSTYSHGGESDQQWLLYNLRATFDYCVLGYPNATGIGINPCVTSEACGGIEDALIYGVTNSTGDDTFGYCDVEGHLFTGGTYQGCLDCVLSEGRHSYVSNFLTALDAGCQQRPAHGSTISLNETIFSLSPAQVTDPDSSSSSNSSHGLAAKYIAAIAVCGVAFAVGLAVCIWYTIRVCKRRKEHKMASRSALDVYCNNPEQMGRGGGSAAWWYPQDGEAGGYYAQEGAAAAGEKNWDQGQQQQQQMAEDPNQMYVDYQHQGGDVKTQPPQPRDLIVPQQHVNIAVPQPETVHSQPFSPDDYHQHHYTTPTSTTSYYSNAPFLGQASSASQQFSSGSSPVAATSHSQGEVWHQQGASDKASRAGGRKSGKNKAGTPTESTNLQIKFPPPPKR